MNKNNSANQANKLKIQDLSIQTQSLSDSNNIIGANNCSVTTSCSYSYSYSYSYGSSYSYSSSFSTSYACNQPDNQAQEGETVAYFDTGYNPWRRR